MLALSKHLPMLLSNTKPYEMYTEARKIHPNHLGDLPKELEALEQILEPEQRPDAFVERIFVQDQAVVPVAAGHAGKASGF